VKLEKKLMSAASGSQPGISASIRPAWLSDELALVEKLIPLAELPADATSRVTRMAQKLVTLSRDLFFQQGGVDAFLQEYNLSSEEGVILMCLAEALLRIPDNNTANRLIQEKLSNADWAKHLGASHSLYVNASSWGLMLTGHIVTLDEESHNLKKFFKKLVSRSGEAVIRLALKEAMHIMAKQFVMGETIKLAIERSQSKEPKTLLYSYDMLGEAALTQKDADDYFSAYLNAIREIKKQAPPPAESLSLPLERPGISVKLSALHPRFEPAQYSRVINELTPRLIKLAKMAMAADIGLTIDAEESSLLELQLQLFEKIFTHPDFRHWSGLGLAVQAYQKRALPVLEHLAGLAKHYGKLVMIRLVKGAYWDTEIKRAQEAGLESYPVFTRKVSTDISYLACAHYIRNNLDRIYPQFATHNIYTIAAVIEIMGNKGLYEFQRLHGMGNAIFQALNSSEATALPVRVYAPVGNYENLLPYLVRRLLENGANTSFLNRFANRESNIDALIQPPVETIRTYEQIVHPDIPLPAEMFGQQRRNSQGYNLDDPALCASMEKLICKTNKIRAHCLINGKSAGSNPDNIYNPANVDELIGSVTTIDADSVAISYKSALAARIEWQLTGANERADILDRMADLLEKNVADLLWLIVKEGGKCIKDALAEIREAVDFCRYYALQTRTHFSNSTRLPGPTGESNELSWHSRGVFICISPWNFPLAIFLGQIAAALAAGNTVIAKPASQGALTAYKTVQLFYQAGIPGNVLHLLNGDATVIGKELFAARQLGGAAFTGSIKTARIIQSQLSQRPGAMLPLIAETGGQNTMIVDSSALLEQVVQDTITSAFNSAGQRCSALRVLYIQREIADNLIDMLSGAMDELCVGDPAIIATDMGPLISVTALKNIKTHNDMMNQTARNIHRNERKNLPLGGHYLWPQAFEIHSISQLTHEVFGPVLHIIRYDINKLEQVIDAINGTGYGLTLGIHSRIESVVRQILRRIRVGNIYINRNMIGAQVGVQPFGGEGLSGTGPKAGGPNYLQRFAIERSLSNNISAIGGNTHLMSLDD